MDLDWQTESGLRTAVFLSAASADLGECRNHIASVLRKAGVYDIEQANFAHSPLTIEEDLAVKILSADAVICLIGGAFGVAPMVDGVIGDRSYTQLEYDLATRYEKPIYLFIATDEYLHAHIVDEPECLRANQMAYREALLKPGGLRYELFSSAEVLETQIQALLAPIHANAGRRSIRFVHVPPLPACFVGRTDEMAQVDAAINRRVPSVIAILGMAGQGKTTLLAQALRERRGLPFAGGVWVSAELDFSFSEFVDSALSEFLGRRFQKEAIPGLDARLRVLIGQLQTRPLLIVIDAVERWLKGWVGSGEVGGFEDLSQRQGALEGLDRFLVEASALDNGSHVVLTSRALPATLDTVACAILPVLPTNARNNGLRALPAEAAAELLLQLGVVAPREKLMRLAESMFGHPLTLTGFARVARKLGSKWESLLTTQGTDPVKVFRSLIDEIRQHLPDRRRSESILRYASLLAEGASVDLLAWLILSDPVNVLRPPDGAKLAPLLLTLADWNLLTWYPAAEDVRLHGLMTKYFLELIEPVERESIHRRAGIWYMARHREGGDTRHGVLALRHALDANDVEGAYAAMFQAGGDTRCLYQRMTEAGQLWECAGLLEALLAKSTGVLNAQVVVVWAQVLHELELPKRALSELQEATRMLLASDSRSAGVDALLARCLAVEAAIHLEAGRATDALSLLDRAAAMFLELAEAGSASENDLITTIANRGLAKWAIGDWDGAEADWQSMIERLSSVVEGPGHAAQIRWELEGRIALLAVDRGNAGAAIPRIESAARELERLRISAAHRPSKASLHMRILLIAAYIENGQIQDALAMANETATYLEDLSRLGRWEFHGLLAQLRVNEATALLQQQRAKDALVAANKAVLLYEDIQGRGALQFYGQRATALFRRAEARIYSGNLEHGTEDVRCALADSESWLRDWHGECNIQGAFLQNAFRALTFLPSSCAPEKLTILRILRACAERIAMTSHPLAAVTREKGLLQQHRDDLKKVTVELGVSLDSIFP